MGSRRFRIVVVIVALAALGFAGNQIRLSNRILAEEQSSEQAFTDLGWEATLTLAELRSAQQAYVADGQDREYWNDRADTHLEAARRHLDDLKRDAEPAAFVALDEAVAVVDDIRRLDADARELIGSDQPLQASDEIFTRGLDLFRRAAEAVRAAAQAERAARAAAMNDARATQVSMLWLAAGVFFLSMLVLAPLNRSAGQDASADADEYDAAEAAALSMLPVNKAPTDDLSTDDGGEAQDTDETETGDEAPAAGAPPVEPAAPDLGATAALCTDFSNLTDQQQVPELLARTATLLNASGLVVWVHDDRDRTLQPALEHGYPAGTRIGSIPRTADNPTSAAFNARRIQVVASDGSDAGALAAPLMVADRCIGVLTAELRDGWESSDAVQATASIVAAQLAPLLPDNTAADTLPAAATGTHDKEGAEPPSASSSDARR